MASPGAVEKRQPVFTGALDIAGVRIAARTEAMLSLCAIEPHLWVLLLSCFGLLGEPGCLQNDLLLCLSHQRLQAVRCRLGVATLCAHTGD